MVNNPCCFTKLVCIVLVTGWCYGVSTVDAAGNGRDRSFDSVAVRYGWANVPEGNLFNRVNLPATPFRTDVD